MSTTEKIDSLIDHIVNNATGYDTYTRYNLRPLNSPFSEHTPSAIAEGRPHYFAFDWEGDVAADDIGFDDIESVVAKSPQSLCVSAPLNLGGPDNPKHSEKMFAISADGNTIYAAPCLWDAQASPASNPVSIFCSSKEHLPNSTSVQTLGTPGEEILQSSLKEVKGSIGTEPVPSGLYLLRVGERTTTFVVRR